MVRRASFILPLFLLLGFFLSGCPKRIPERIPETIPYENPVFKILDAFSPVESFRAKASIRIDTVRKGEEMSFLLNGTVLYQQPDKLRILGYHPFGMGVFDAVYRNGKFFLLSPLQKKAYTGEISEFEDLMEKSDVRVLLENPEGKEIPTRIRIELKEKEASVEMRLKDISLRPSLPEDAFEWKIPEGVDVQPLSKLIKGKKL
jgi:outer membrane lipoprotein-sorting protein